MKYKRFKQTVEQFIQNHTRNIKKLSPSEQPPAPISILPYAAWHSFDCTLCLIAYNSLYSNFPSHIYKYFFFSFSVRSKIQPHSNWNSWFFMQNTFKQKPKLILWFLFRRYSPNFILFSSIFSGTKHKHTLPHMFWCYQILK